VLGKITHKVISDQNQNHMSKIDLKSSSKSFTREVIFHKFFSSDFSKIKIIHI